MKANKGAIWVSAVLYLTLGIVAISLILTAAIPLVTKIKDRNTVIQTKNMLFTLDDTIKTVVNEGPGSQRELAPFIITAGELIFESAADEIIWTMDTTALIQEPGISIQEGTVLTELKQHPNIEGRYSMELKTTYPSIDILLNSTFANPFVGEYSALIRHTGRFTGNKPVIEIKMT